MTEPLTHQINSRTLTTFSPITQELQLNSGKNYLFDLPHLGALSINGDKAVEFLQGQLTADITKVDDVHMIQTAQCNLKGRILSLLDIVQWNELLLVTSKDMLAATQNSLAKTAMLSRVTMHEAQELAFFGFYMQNPEDIVPFSIFLPKVLYGKSQGDGFCYYHLGEGFYIFIVRTDKSSALKQSFADKNQLLGSLTWHTLRLQHKQLTIYPESRGLFLPHRLNLQQTSYLSFEKGCYKGQEIIARTHYRATLKHELRLFIINCEHALFSGQKLLNRTEDIEQGELVDYSVLDTNRYLIAVSMLKTASLEVRLEQTQDVLLLEPFEGKVVKQASTI